MRRTESGPGGLAHQPEEETPAGIRASAFVFSAQARQDGLRLRSDGYDGREGEAERMAIST